MTIVYGGVDWLLDENGARRQPAGEEPQAVDLDALPLPVARVLRSLGFVPASA
jgi:hypothetical protein